MKPFPAELRERVVLMVREQAGEHASEGAAMRSVAYEAQTCYSEVSKFITGVHPMSMQICWAVALAGLAWLPTTVYGQGSDEESRQATTTRTYYGEMQIGGPLAFRLKRVPRGDVASHACLQGSYTHVYRGAGWSGQEVWLCCIPVEDVLSDAFQCATGAFPPILGSSEYLKIRHCSLLHPTAAEATHIPVCIPAPIKAPGTEP